MNSQCYRSAVYSGKWLESTVFDNLDQFQKELQKSCSCVYMWVCRSECLDLMTFTYMLSFLLTVTTIVGLTMLL